MHRHSLKNGKHRNRPLQEAWDASTPEDWVWDIVCLPIGGHHPETMTALEIAVLTSYPDSFNLMIPVQAYLGAGASTRAKLSAERNERWADPAYRSRVKASHAERNADPDYRERHREAMVAFNATDEGKAIRSRVAKESWADPEKRKKLSEARRKLWADPEYRARQAESRKKSWANPESRSRRIDGLKRGWAESSPEDREARVKIAGEAQRRDDVREKLRAATQRRWDEGKGPRPRKTKS